MRKYLLLLAFVCVALAAVKAYADSCNTSVGGPCTLPCPTASATAQQILGVNNQRTELMVQNTGSTTIYVILGNSTSGTADYTYGIPLAPYGQAESMLDLQIQPDPTKGLHTWTSAVKIVTQSGTGSCIYGEQSN